MIELSAPEKDEKLVHKKNLSKARLGEFSLTGFLF